MLDQSQIKSARTASKHIATAVRLSAAIHAEPSFRKKVFISSSLLLGASQFVAAPYAAADTAGARAQDLKNQIISFISLVFAVAIAVGLCMVIMGFLELKAASSEGGGGRATKSGGWQKVIYGGLTTALGVVVNLSTGTFLGGSGNATVQGGTASLS